MSGRVVLQAKHEHKCAPGWTYKDAPWLTGAQIAVPPSPWLYPPGTVWQCDCGRTWVSTGSPGPGSPGMCDFRPERRGERRKREHAP